MFDGSRTGVRMLSAAHPEKLKKTSEGSRTGVRRRAQLHTVNRSSEAGPCSDPGTLRRRSEAYNISRKDKEDMEIIERFTAEELKMLKWAASRPEIIPAEKYEEIKAYYDNSNELPKEYKGVLEVVRTEEGLLSLVDINYKNWLDIGINQKYIIPNSPAIIGEKSGNSDYMLSETSWKISNKLILLVLLKEKNLPLDVSPEFYKNEYIAITKEVRDLTTKPTLREERARILEKGLKYIKKKCVSSALVEFQEKTPQANITSRELQFAFTTKKNKTAYVVDLDKQLRFDFDEYGNPTKIRIEEPKDREAYEATLNREDIKSDILDADLLATLFTAARAAYMGNYGDRITVNIPNFAKALGVHFIDKYKGDNEAGDKSRFPFWEKIHQLENIGGVIVQKGLILRAFTLLSVDTNNNSLTFASPYLYELWGILQSHPAAISHKMENDKPLYEIEGISYLVYAEMIKARNKATAQVVKNLIAGLHQRGSQKKYKNEDGKIIYHISYKELIERSPILLEQLENAGTNKAKSKVLQRAFFGLRYNQTDKNGELVTETIIEEYFRKYTRAFEYWKELEFEFDPVTPNKLNGNITITHAGTNKLKNNNDVLVKE